MLSIFFSLVQLNQSHGQFSASLRLPPGTLLACLLIRPRGLPGCENDETRPLDIARSGVCSPHLHSQPLVISGGCSGDDSSQHFRLFPWHYGNIMVCEKRIVEYLSYLVIFPLLCLCLITAWLAWRCVTNDKIKPTSSSGLNSRKRMEDRGDCLEVRPRPVVLVIGETGDKEEVSMVRRLQQSGLNTLSLGDPILQACVASTSK